MDAFLCSFRRISTQRRLPRKLYSDNAKTFKSASKEVKQILSPAKVKRALINSGIDWEFIILKSPWMGGAWERLVRSVKRSLKKVVGRASLS